MMRILLVQDADWRNKGPHPQHHLMEQMSIRGHEIRVIGFDQLWRDHNDGILYRRVAIQGISRFYKGARVDYIGPRFLRIPTLDYVSFFLTSRGEIKSTIDEWDPDIVISFTSIASSFWGMRYAKKRHIPFVYYWTDVTHSLISSRFFQNYAKLFEKELMKGSDKVFVTNEVLGDYVSSFGVKREDIATLSHGINFSLFDPLIDSREIRGLLNISDKDRVMLFMGWIYEFSGLKEVIYGLSKIKALNPHLKLLVIGQGENQNELLEIIKREGLHDTAFFLGWKAFEEIPRYLAASDVCILPAFNNEVMRNIVPIKMFEYLAMEKPVMSTRLPGIEREFGHNSGVIYCERPEDVVTSVSELHQNDLDRRSKEARTYIRSHDWNQIVDRFEKSLASLIKGVSI